MKCYYCVDYIFYATLSGAAGIQNAVGVNEYSLSAYERFI